jgi:uncharacterized damage-inducible protein DinB
MSTPRELVIARLAWTRKGLDEVLGRLSPDLMNWAPGAGMRSISGQLVEIVGSELQVVARLKDGHFVTGDQVREMIGAYEDLDRLKDFLVETRADTLAYLATLSDAELAEAVPIRGWHESIGLPETPRNEIFVGVCQHEAYHVGQLVSYLWARGDDPYKW